MALSIAAFHVSVLTNAQYFEEAIRIQGWGAFFFSIAAGLAALIIVPLSIYHARDMAQNPAHPLVWLLLGASFGFFTPLFTGGFTRISAAFTGVAEGAYSPGDFLSLFIDGVFVFPYDFVVQGAPLIFVGIESGAIFAVTAFVMDRLNATEKEVISVWGPWAVSGIVGFGVLLFALLGPIDFLRDLA